MTCQLASADIQRGRDQTQGPVFIVGCARSGTTLLYHTLVSSGAFVNYRAETHFFDKLEPVYGPFDSRKARCKLVDAWQSTEAFKRFGVDSDAIRSKIINECDTAGEVLKCLFESAARVQGRKRWAECTPLHLLSMAEIQKQLPDATFVHVIRDGRDVALSLRKVGWTNPLPWDRDMELLAGAWTWEWQIHKARSIAETIGESYHEVRFEDLVRDPRETLSTVSEWIGHPLDWTTVKQQAIGTVAAPNTAFAENISARNTDFDPVYRWKRQLSERELSELQTTIGTTLTLLGYPIADMGQSNSLGKSLLKGRKFLHQANRGTQLWFKHNTPMSRIFTDPELDDL